MSPDGSPKPLPEEKLLSLIRGKPARSAAPAAAGAGAAPAPAPGRPRARAPVHWPRIAITGLGLVLALEAVWLAGEALRPLPTVELPESGGGPPGPAIELAKPPSLTQGISRELFVPPEAADPGPGPAGRGPSQTATELAARLSLLGIVAGDPPQAIIEDSQTRKTHFVSPGQPVTEGAIVEQIFESRVVLDLQGEKIELSL